MAQFFCSPQLHQFKFQGIGICFWQMWGLGPSASPEPYRCLFHINPVIPNGHFTLSLSFCIESIAHNLLLLVAVFKHPYHATATGQDS